MGHLKYGATGHLLFGPNGHLVHTCGGGCPGAYDCEDDSFIGYLDPAHTLDSNKSYEIPDTSTGGSCVYIGTVACQELDPEDPDAEPIYLDTSTWVERADCTACGEATDVTPCDCTSAMTHAAECYRVTGHFTYTFYPSGGGSEVWLDCDFDIEVTRPNPTICTWSGTAACNSPFECDPALVTATITHDSTPACGWIITPSGAACGAVNLKCPGNPFVGTKRTPVGIYGDCGDGPGTPGAYRLDVTDLVVSECEVGI